jgi:L-threonylcarbamoyladenylate synthase
MPNFVSAFHVQQSVRILRAGGVIAYATESVWGLGCDPMQEAAVERLLAIKQRDANKGLILIASTWAQVAPWLLAVSAEHVALMQSTWPGPVTWLAPIPPGFPRWLYGQHDRIALRVSAHTGVQALCTAFGGPLVSTSANRSGMAAARNALSVRLRLGNELDFILPGRVAGLPRPSEIRDLCSQRIVRPG